MTTPTADEIRSCRAIAAHMFALGGPDLRHMTDEELVRHCREWVARLSKAARAMALTCEEAGRGLAAFGAASRRL